MTGIRFAPEILISGAVRDEALPATLRDALRVVLADMARELSERRAIPPDDAADYVASAALQAGIGMFYQHGRAAGEAPGQVARDLHEHVADIVADARSRDPFGEILRPSDGADPTSLTFNPPAANG